MKNTSITVLDHGGLINTHDVLSVLDSHEVDAMQGFLEEADAYIDKQAAFKVWLKDSIVCGALEEFEKKAIASIPEGEIREYMKNRNRETLLSLFADENGGEWSSKYRLVCNEDFSSEFELLFELLKGTGDDEGDSAKVIDFFSEKSKQRIIQKISRVADEYHKNALPLHKRHIGEIIEAIDSQPLPEDEIARIREHEHRKVEKMKLMQEINERIAGYSGQI